LLSQRAAGRRVDPGLLILLLEAARFEGSVDAAQLSLKLLTALDSQGAHAMAGLAGVGELRRGRPLAVKVPQRAREVLVQVLLGADMLHEAQALILQYAERRVGCGEDGGAAVS
jgi:hypothetical protein